MASRETTTDRPAPAALGSDPELLATLVVSALDGLGVQSWFDATVDPASATESFADALLGGLCGPR